MVVVGGGRGEREVAGWVLGVSGQGVVVVVVCVARGEGGRVGEGGGEGRGGRKGRGEG